MTDREKLLKLYNDLKAVNIPVFDNVELSVLVNTIEQGLLFMVGWLTDAAREHFTNSR